LLYPLVFCRECGQDYYVVKYDVDREMVAPLLPNSIDTDDDRPTPCWFIPRPFKICLNCKIVHNGRKNEFVKLSRLSSEGRSTATTLLSISTVSKLKAILPATTTAAKVLSFTDNRQDASLQAGHFNDFVQTSFLRSSLRAALEKTGELEQAKLAAAVVAQVGLAQTDYAKEPADFGIGKKRNEEAFTQLIEYRLYEDLRRGWRIVQPNLEQCGLLRIEYLDLVSVCESIELWAKHQHPILLKATPAQRYQAIIPLLNLLRKELAEDRSSNRRTRSRPFGNH
jgi:hypothetical protein